MPPLTGDFLIEKSIAGCDRRPSIRLVNQSQKTYDTDIIMLSLGDGTISDQVNFEHHYATDGVYNVKLTAVRKAGTSWCVSEKQETIHAFSLRVPNVMTPVYPDGKNDSFIIQYGDEGSMAIDYGYKVKLVVYNRWGKSVYANNDYRNNWDGDVVNDGVYFYELQVNDGREACKGWIQIMNE